MVINSRFCLNLAPIYKPMATLGPDTPIDSIHSKILVMYYNLPF